MIPRVLLFLRQHFEKWVAYCILYISYSPLLMISAGPWSSHHHVLDWGWSRAHTGLASALVEDIACMIMAPLRPWSCCLTLSPPPQTSCLNEPGYDLVSFHKWIPTVVLHPLPETVHCQLDQWLSFFIF